MALIIFLISIVFFYQNFSYVINEKKYKVPGGGKNL